jgi:nitrate reductase delta subunit
VLRAIAGLHELIRGDRSRAPIFSMPRSATSVVFDRTRSLSLHLFEHVHGESRSRPGDGRSDQVVRGWRLFADDQERPISCLLEFASTRTPAAAIELVPSRRTSSLRCRSGCARRSRYAAVFSALVARWAKPDRRRSRRLSPT